MGQSAIPAAITAKAADDLRAAIVGELVPIIPSATDPQTWDPRELGGSGGNVWQAVIWQEKIWYRDDASIADHDEITCIILLDGGHYLTNDVKFTGYVLSRTVTTPPDPDDVDPEARPAYGDQYRVPAGATDDWAGHEDDIAMWTARGWVFHTPQTGELHYVVDESGYEHFSAADVWADGFGSLVFQSGSIRPSNLLIRAWAVENQTTNAPPATGPAGEQYIIGPSPTGAWAGNAKKIAWRPSTNAAFVITTPFTGELVYDKNLNNGFRWTGLVWIAAAGALLGFVSEFTQGSGSAAFGGGSGTYAYSSSTPPTTAKAQFNDNVTIAYTARAGSRLRFRYEANCIFDVAGVFTWGLFYDNVSSPVAYGSILADADLGLVQTFAWTRVIAAPDGSVHTWKIKVFVPAGSAALILTERYFGIEEII